MKREVLRRAELWECTAQEKVMVAAPMGGPPGSGSRSSKTAARTFAGIATNGNDSWMQVHGSVVWLDSVAAPENLEFSK